MLGSVWSVTLDKDDLHWKVLLISLQTYNSDYMVPDSASTAFAMYSGVKTSGYTMGFDNTVGYMELDTVENANRPSTILDWAQVKWKSLLSMGW